MFRSLIIIGIGGFTGSIGRYLLSNFVNNFISSAFPYGTFAVNLAGCFFIGVIYALFDRGNILTPEWRLFLATGFCGGFTTFSTFSYESIKLAEGGEFFNLSMNIAASVILGFAATYFGMVIIKSI
ncbi:MAG: fluoride efflux transporter CrcB [Saprospiraceae bacterium]|nr:MAG: fluoride efflux transporter CrcB [Saprospiraceae bacterium]